MWFVLNLSWVLHRSTADLPMLFWLFPSTTVLNFGRQGICINHFSTDLWVQNQPFACVARISKTLLRSSCICLAARTAISIKKKREL